MRATLYPELVEKVESLGRRGQVLEGIWAGKATKEIAAELGLSPKTVEYHRAQLYRVFGVNDLVSLCRRAIAAGLIKMPEAMPKAMPDALPMHCPCICETSRSGMSQPERRARASRANAKFRAI
jgi:DNA-binding CsgD family transcriptional regulator